MKQLGTIAATVPLLVWTGTAIADPGFMGYGGYGGYGGLMGGGHGLFAGLAMLVFWVAVIALVVYAVRWFTEGRRPGAGRRNDALDILRDRFARGEIDEDEFKRRKAALEA